MQFTIKVAILEYYFPNHSQRILGIKWQLWGQKLGIEIGNSHGVGCGYLRGSLNYKCRGERISDKLPLRGQCRVHQNIQIVELYKFGKKRLSSRVWIYILILDKLSSTKQTFGSKSHKKSYHMGTLEGIVNSFSVKFFAHENDRRSLNCPLGYVAHDCTSLIFKLLSWYQDNTASNKLEVICPVTMRTNPAHNQMSFAMWSRCTKSSSILLSALLMVTKTLLFWIIHTHCQNKI
jgi:hypothetical protein